MHSRTDISTVDLARTCLQLRHDLKFVPQHYGGRTWVHIEATATTGFYRVGFTEYVFLSLLDGQTTFAAALAVTARSQGATALTEVRAEALYRWALDEGLGRFTDADVAAGHASAGPKKPDAARQAAKLNPFWIRIPLGHPDRLLHRMKPALGWLFSVPATVCAVAFMLYALVQLLSSWQQFEHASRHVFAPDNWIWLMAAWIGLKLIHEIAHGLVCQRYGGSVRESGVILAFFAPLAYVDVTSSWGFSSRWQRIHTSLAGIYIELFAASVAILFWLSAESEQAAHLLYNVIVMASLSTILFNANPLMRFDGYYVLSDLLQIPNLSSRASEALQHSLKKVLLGMDPPVPAEVGSRGRTLIIYGIASSLWKLIICTSLVIAASVLFHGAGLAIAAAGVTAWVGVPAIRLFQSLQTIGRRNPMRLIRGVTLSVATAGLVVAVLTLTPVPFGATAPGVVELPEGSAVRAEVDGFIEELHITPGQQVSAGDLLITLRNRELEAEHADLRLQLQQAQLRHDEAVDRHNAADAGVAADEAVALQKRLTRIAERVAGLQLKSTIDGHVVLRSEAMLQGRYVQEGDELMMIDSRLPLQLHISVAQEDQPQFQQLKNQPFRVRVGTRPAFEGTLARMTPRASLSLSHPCLATPEGGTLAVTAGDDEREYQLTEQRFNAVINLPAEVSATLCPGERGYAVFDSAQPNLASHAWHVAAEWIDSQFANASRQAL